MTLRTCILIFLLAVSSAAGEAAPGAAKIGSITSLTGDVLVRSKGVWKPVTNVPFDLYSSDKVVTKRGRAEVDFDNGNSAVMDLSSNVSFSGGKQVQVNVLLGEVWFDTTAGGPMSIKTPSMTSSASGASGAVKVNLSGQSAFGLKTGDAETTGTFKKLPPAQTASAPDTAAKALPKTDPAVENSPLQKTASEAAQAHVAAVLKTLQAAKQTKEAKSTEKAASKGLDSSKKKAAVLSADAAVALCDAALSSSKASAETIKEALLEAEIFKDTALVQDLKATLDAAKNNISKQESLSSSVKDVAEKTKASPVSGALVMAKAAEVIANSSVTGTNAVVALSIAATAAASGDDALLASSQESANVLQQLTTTTEIAANNAITAAENNDLGAVLEAAEAAGGAARESAIITGAPIEAIPVAAPAEPPVIVITPPAVDTTPIPDTKDLPTASPSS